MKKTANVCIPWRDTVYRIGALLLFGGVFLMLALNAKSLAVTYWKGDSLTAIDQLMMFVVMLAAAAMMCFPQKFLPRMAAFMLLLGSSRIFFGDIFLTILIPVILLLTAIGGRWNRVFPPLMRRHIPTPWLCLIGAVCVGVKFVVTLVRFIRVLISVFGGEAGRVSLWVRLTINGAQGMFLLLVILAGVFLLLFFTQPVPRDAISDVTISRTVIRRDNPCFRVAGFVLLAHLAISLITNRDVFSYIDRFWEYVAVLLPYVIELIAIILVFARKRSNLLWLVFCLMFISVGTGYAGWPKWLFMLMLIPAVGFVGNDPIFEREGMKITPADIVLLAVFALLLIADVRALVTGIRTLLEAQPHKVTPEYRADAWPEVLELFGIVLRDAAMAMLVLFSRLERCKTTIVAKALTNIARIKNIRRNFQNAAGRKICRLAYVFSSIFVVLMLISLAGALVCLLLFITDAIYGWLPFDVPIMMVVYCLAAALVFFFDAMGTWFIYAYGQAADDLHKVSHRLTFGLALPRVDGRRSDDDLPDF